jgi:hypothetical protein
MTQLYSYDNAAIHCFNIYHSMRGSALQCYGRLLFHVGICDFWIPAPP